MSGTYDQTDGRGEISAQISGEISIQKNSKMGYRSFLIADRCRPTQNPHTERKREKNLDGFSTKNYENSEQIKY